MAGIVTIERPIPGLLVVSFEGAEQTIRRRFLALDSNQRFNSAAAYASKLAAEMGAEMIDRTGRLSPAQCAALVEPWHADAALPDRKQD